MKPKRDQKTTIRLHKDELETILDALGVFDTESKEVWSKHFAEVYDTIACDGGVDPLDSDGIAEFKGKMGILNVDSFDISLDKREVNTVLASLRIFQKKIQQRGAESRHRQLNAGEIDDLCERINLA